MKCYLRKHFLADPEKVIFYSISASDGSYRQIPDAEKAMTAYENLIDFQKRQLNLDL